MTSAADRQLEQARAVVAFHQALKERRAAAPADFYVLAKDREATIERGGLAYARSMYYMMSDAQEAAHRSPHAVRLMALGNGGGKTRCMATEAAWWLKHRHPFQQTPKHPILALWVPPDYQQFENFFKNTLPECFYAGWTWNENKHRLEYPSGDCMYVYSQEKGWKSVQGSEWDLVLCDEQPPLMLWRELTMRRRAKRKTRYMIAATATQGESWMEEEIYKVWLAHHQEQGLDEEGAMRAQSHKRYWCWAKGGIHDNPAADIDDQDWYKERRWSSEAEKRVRLYGGFARFNGSPVFDQAAVDKLMEELRARVEAGQLSRLGSVRLDAVA